MGKFLDEIPDYLAEWILQQQVFWVASAPLSPDGHVNISPKGIEGTFRIAHSRRVWYEDLSGTGAETVAHIRENGRVTILFNAFEGPARIVRLYGKGFFYAIGTPEYDALIGQSKRLAGSRAVIGIDIDKVGTTCGYSVPYYQFLSHRTQLMTWAARKEANDQEYEESNRQQLTQSHQPSTDTIDEQAPISSNGMKQWWLSHNLMSLDGLPAFSNNLGRNFSFFAVLGFSRNTTQMPFSPSPRYSSHLGGPSNSTSNFTTTDVPLNGLEENLKSSSLSRVGEKLVSGYSDRRHDVASLFFIILPYLFVFVVGISLGRLSPSRAGKISSYAL